MTPGDPSFNPFPGLRPFQVEEEYLFFGRETQRQELISLLKTHRFVAVLGASGSGKSSLVRAGLLPALFGGVMVGTGSHWNIAILRPGGAPIRNLAAALREVDFWPSSEPPSLLEIETTLTRSGLGLMETVRQARMPANENLLVVVDQFEELFRFSQSQSERSTRDEAAAFVRLLLETTRQSEPPIYVVLTMRSDFFGDCAQFEDLAETVNKGEYLVPRLNREQKKQAIEGPIKVGGARVAPRLLQQLLNDVGDDPDQLPILQHALMRTWEHWRLDQQPDEPLDLRHYDAIGGMREALSRHADEVFESLPDARHQNVAKKIFKTLTERAADNRGIRRPTRLDALSAISGATETEVRSVLEALRKPGCTFLMPPQPAPLDPETIIDISHESLMRVWQRLRRWVEEEAQSARIYSRLADTAALHAEGKAGLYHDPDLQIALSWREIEHPTLAWAQRYHPGFELAICFLDQSAAANRAEEAAREAARRRELEQARALAEAERQRAQEQVRFTARLKWLVRGLGVVAMIAIMAMLLALAARKQAQANAELARQNELKAMSNATLARKTAERMRESAYAADMRAAQVALEQNSRGQAMELLRKYLPLPGETDLRGIEWRYLWKRTASTEIASLQHPHLVTSAKFAPNGKLIVTDCYDGVVRIWDWRSNVVTTSFQVREPSLRGASGCFSADSSMFAVIQQQGIALLNTTNWAQIRFLPVPDVDPYRSRVLFSGNGALLGMSVTNGLWLWDTATWQRRFFETETTRVGSWDFMFSTDALSLAVADWSSRQTQHRVYSLADGRMAVSFISAGEQPFFTMHGKTLLSCDWDGLLSAWSLSDPATPLWKIQAHRGSARGVAVSPDGRTIATSGHDQVIRLWDANTGTNLTLIGGHENELWDVDFSRDGRHLVSASKDGTAKVWDLEKVHRTDHLTLGTNQFFAQFAGTNDVVVSENLADRGTLNYFDEANQRTRREFSDPLQFSPRRSAISSSRLYVGLTNGAVQIYDLASGHNVKTMICQQGEIWNLAVTPDDRLLATASYDNARQTGKVRLWSLESGVLMREFTDFLRGHLYFHQIALSQDGKFIAYPSENYAIKIWDWEKNRLLSNLVGHKWFLNVLVFSSDAALLASGGWEGDVRLWNVREGKEAVPPLRGHGSGVFALTFSNDGRTLISSGDDNNIRFWSTATGQQMLVLENLRACFLSPTERRIVYWSPDGALIVEAIPDVQSIQALPQ